jgi:hypothetical protein
LGGVYLPFLRVTTVSNSDAKGYIGERMTPPEEPDETCWLVGEGWWLSTAPVDLPNLD